MDGGIFELAVIILIAATLGIFAQLLKQPLVLAYLITGIIIGYSDFFHLTNRETWEIFSDLGIMFLLFLVGLEINYSSLKLVGKDSVILGVGQVLFTFIFGYIIAQIFGYSYVASAYIAIALTFSSTIIIVKLLSEKRDLNSLYGKLSIGFLLVQDLIVILLLVILAGIETGEGVSLFAVPLSLLKGIVLFAVMLWLGRKVLPYVFDKIARSAELLFLVSLAWVFIVVAFVGKLGFSIEIGGFLAGLALANSSEHFQIAGRIKALRDFFIVVFFVILGSSILFTDISGIGLPVLVFSLFVLIGNPFIVMLLMGIRGYRKRTGFMAGITVAQISEFSLILGALGLKLGHITEAEVALISAVGVITITISTYMVMNADFIYSKIYRILSIFEFRHSFKTEVIEDKKDKSILLVGCKRVGKSMLTQLSLKKVLVVEFDPEVVKVIAKEGYDYLFGDISDPDLYEHIDFSSMQLVISTVPSYQVNLAMLEFTKRIREERGYTFKIIVRARDDYEARLLYQNGADYVLLPHVTTGYYFGKAIARNTSMQFLDNLRTRDIGLMKQAEDYRRHT